MARGFDSKSVADQQDELERRRENRPVEVVGDSPRRRTLELARRDLLRRLEAAPDAHKPSMQAALAALDELIAKA